MNAIKERVLSKDDDTADEKLKDAIDAYVRLLTFHIDKENKVLFHTAAPAKRKQMKSAVVLRIIYLSACFFGLASIISGGSVLFSGGHFRENVGNYVPFVVWSNFLLGFVYVVTGAGLLRKKQWAVWSSLFILTATLAVFFWVDRLHH